MLSMNRITFLFCLFYIILFTSCNNIIDSYDSFTSQDDSLYIGKYKTEYVIYWTPYDNDSKVIYSDNEVYTCSFQGTNFLLEKDNSEEIFSTTAPIKIKSCIKITKQNH